METKLKPKKKSDRRLEEIARLIQEGAGFIEDIEEATGLKRRSLKDYTTKLRKQGYDIPPFKDGDWNGRFPPERNDKWDELIAKGLSLNELEEPTGYSRETIRTYVLATNQKETHIRAKKMRKKIKQTEKYLTQRGFNLDERDNLSGDSLWTFDMAVGYYLKQNGVASNPSEVRAFLMDYRLCKQQGTYKPLSGLDSKLSKPTKSRILNALKLPPLR
jgi:hypothetical protein